MQIIIGEIDEPLALLVLDVLPRCASEMFHSSGTTQSKATVPLEPFPHLQSRNDFLDISENRTNSDPSDVTKDGEQIPDPFVHGLSGRRWDLDSEQLIEREIIVGGTTIILVLFQRGPERCPLQRA